MWTDSYQNTNCSISDKNLVGLYTFISEDFLVTAIAIFSSEHFCTNEEQPTCQRKDNKKNPFNKFSKCNFEYWLFIEKLED